jgi:hypothetical protein
MRSLRTLLSLLPIIFSLLLLCCCYTMSFISQCKVVHSLTHAVLFRSHSQPYMVASQRFLIPAAAHTVRVHRQNRLYSPTSLSSASSDGSEGGGETVVSICTQKIRDLIKPVQLSVTSTNDDPNGSHVRLA